MENFEFNAPQYTDFHSVDSDDSAERYFDVDHECNWSYMTGEKNETLVEEESEAITNSEAAENVSHIISKTPKSRKTECDIIKTFEGLVITTPLPKKHVMETRLDKKYKSPALELRSRSILREKEENAEIEIKIRKRKKSEQSDQLPEKYMCMAEAIEKFQKTTPARFHSRPRNMKVDFSKKNAPLKCTIPLSPHLKVMRRNRQVNVLSRQQMESLEVEEMKKYQIKAHPLNEKIFKPPSMNLSHRSHFTEVKPFNLTEYKRKIQQPLPTVVKFTARPVPKGLFGKKDDRKNISAPNLLRSNSDIPIRHRVPVISKAKENKVNLSKSLRKGPISAKPFSFDERDKNFLKKKEEKIKEILEEEKKAREFHANPLPKFSKSFVEKPTILPTIPQPFHLSADDKGLANKEKWEKKVEEERRLMKEAAIFKARPSKVLTQKPFLPSKTEHPSLELPEIHLNTELRSKDRALFDKELQDKMELQEKLKMERQQELQKRLEDEIAEARKNTVHKANPVKHYKRLTIQSAVKPLTLPLSPRSFNEKK